MTPVHAAMVVVDSVVPRVSHFLQPSFDFEYPSVSLQIPQSGPYAPGMHSPWTLPLDAFAPRQAVGGWHLYIGTTLDLCRVWFAAPSRLADVA